MANLVCLPRTVSLSCNRPTSQTKVRVRTSDRASGVQVDAFGHDPRIASLDPASGKTDNAGTFDVFVHCVEGGPCPARTTVTFDAAGYVGCTLEIECTDHKAANLTNESLTAVEKKEAAAQEAFEKKDYQGAARNASEAAAERKSRADSDASSESKAPDFCAECEDYLKAAQDFELASAAQRKLGNQAAANDLQKKADEAYDNAAEACETCGGLDLELGRLDSADQAYGRAIAALKKRGKDASKQEKARRKIRLLIKKYLHSIGFGRPLTEEEERELQR